MPQIVATARTLLGDIRQSAYHDRLFAVLDSRHGAEVQPQLERAGVSPDNIVVWERNGIEYYYPRSILQSYFGVYEELTIVGDEVSANGRTIRKRELADYVASRMTGAEELPDELISKLIQPLDALLA
jgi:hypothetical protein